MVTIRDVAKRAEVSVATVSHVVNGTRKVSPQTAERVRKAMEELGYQPNLVARSLRKRTTFAIGVLVTDITNPFFASLVRGVEDAAIRAGYSVIVCNSDEDPTKEDMHIRELRRRRIDGMLIAPTRDGTSSALYELSKHKLPFVLIDRKAKGLNAPVVLSDNVRGAYLATRYLLEKGYRRIGIVLGIPGATSAEERFLGYVCALKEAGIPIQDDLIVWGEYRVDSARRATAQLLSLREPPQAIFSTNNLMTLGVLQEIFHRKLVIPNDVAVVGFDDVDWAEMVQPPLTVVAQKPYEIGQQAFEILLSEIKGEQVSVREVRVSVELKVRGSA